MGTCAADIIFQKRLSWSMDYHLLFENKIFFIQILSEKFFKKMLINNKIDIN